MKTVFYGVLLGTAVGDSLGLPAEGLSPGRIQKRWPGPWRHRLFLGRGMVSDDTEHTLWVARSLVDSPDDSDLFQRRLAWRLRWWLAGLPAGVGFATLRASVKLWLGFPRTASGVFSAGNGPAMRSAIIGAFFAGDDVRIRDYVRASTRLTHTDPKAETAALAVALTASHIIQNKNPATCRDAGGICDLWLSAGRDDAEWNGCVREMASALKGGRGVREFAHKLGLQHGVSGYAYHSVPVALYAWIRHAGDFRAALEAALDCGGDTDSVGAICGALAGIEGGIPAEWIDRIVDWPVSTRFLERQAEALEACKTNGRRWQPFFPWPGVLFRNAFFLFIVILHGLRRLIPL